MSKSSIASSDNQQPLNPNSGDQGSEGTRTTSLNDRLNTDYVDVGRNDKAVTAMVTKSVTEFVGKFITPRQLLVVLRLLKAITFCFLVLTLAADLMYIAFLEVLASREVRNIVGGRRDMIIRVYGLFLAVIAMFIELDIPKVVKSFYGFKGFIPRAALLFFISSITGAHPLQSNQVEIGDDDAKYDDFIDDNFSEVLDVPGSCIVFQMVTSFVL